MERANTNARRAQRFSARQVLNHCDFRRESILPRLIPNAAEVKPNNPCSIPRKRGQLQATPQRGVHRGELKLLLASARAGGRRPSSGCTNVALSVFSKVHLHEHSGDNDRAVVSERSQSKMATFGPHDFPDSCLGVLSGVSRAYHSTMAASDVHGPRREGVALPAWLQCPAACRTPTPR
ncbi:hypothetical protein MTO96_030883 [Rhipicephalus appendiculatus]